MVYSEISVKAAAIAGAVVGFVFWLLSGYGSYNPMMGYYGMMGYMMGYGYTGWGLGSVVLVVILWAVFGVVVAVVYNWALKMK